MVVGALLVRHDPASAAHVRHQIAADLCSHSVTPDSVDDVVLVASELVGNAITHAAAQGELDVAWDILGDSVIIRVSDSSQELPKARQPDPTATSGRGLSIIAALADEWGVLDAACGKQVWARVPVHHAI